MVELETERTLSLVRNERDHIHHVATRKAIHRLSQVMQLMVSLFHHWREKSVHVITDHVQYNRFRFAIGRNSSTESSYRHSCPWSTSPCLNYSPILILNWDKQHETPSSKRTYPCWIRCSPSSLSPCIETLRWRLFCPINKQTITTNEVETKSFACVSSNLLSADVEAMWHTRVERHWIEHGGRDLVERARLNDSHEFDCQRLKSRLVDHLTWNERIQNEL